MILISFFYTGILLIIFFHSVGRPGKIKGFNFFRNGDGSITLSWEPPEVKGGQALQYLVEYGEDQNKRTQVPNTTIGSDTESVTYTFKVRGNCHEQAY